jgi:pantoate--beta-alanine ligase
LKIFHYRESIGQFRNQFSDSIGFVPTMGALHLGHIDLVKQAKATTNHCFVSIFVNPRQFNNQDDLKKYPRTIDSDLNLLFKAGVDAVFIPETVEFYLETLQVNLNLNPLDLVFEGLYRPGHFNGVVDVLHRFFSVLKPTDVFMGLKDLQQCLVVEKLIQQHFPTIKQHNCDTQREPSGLAMSSRNTRLSSQGKEKAANIYKELSFLSHHLDQIPKNIAAAHQQLSDLGIETEYLSLVSLPNMKNLEKTENNNRMAIIYAGYVDGVRLIDNVVL